MANLLVAKEYMKSFYSKYEIYLLPILKVLMACIILFTINGKLGYMEQLDHSAIVMIAALVCSFMPVNFMLIIASMFIVLHFYALSMECAIVVLGIFMLMFLLYFRFTPKEAICVILTPIFFVMNIPYVMPIAAGLLGGPMSMIGLGCGVISYYMIKFVGDNVNVLTATDAESAVMKFRFVIDGLIDNKEMFVVIAAFAITVIFVYIVRRMSVKHCWMIAIIAGALIDIFILLIGDFMLDLDFSIISILFGSVISVVLCRVLEFFMFNLDYNRTEIVQFEDDEYYYYVKAVPKMSLATPEKKVKKISAPKREQEVKVVRTARKVNQGTRAVVRVKRKSEE